MALRTISVDWDQCSGLCWGCIKYVLSSADSLAVADWVAVVSAGRGHGAGDERGDGERLDDRVGDGGSTDGRRCREPAGGVDAAVVALHKVPEAADAGGLHLQRLRAANHARYQPARLHRWHCVRSGIATVSCSISIQVELILTLS